MTADERIEQEEVDGRSQPRVTSSELASQIRRDIVSGRYLRDERLPPERAIAERHSVSRGTVRDALMQLVEMGLVERRAGSGTYVTYAESDQVLSIVRSTSPLELVDTRLALEPQIVRLAVLHATENAIHKAEGALDVMDRCAGAAEFATADAAFHLALAECTQNTMLIWMTERVNEVRNQAQWTHMRNITLGAQTIKEYNAQHRAVFEAIRRRDAEAAASAMRAHLAAARRSLTDAASS